MEKRKFAKVVDKPWGKEEWIVNEEYCGKILNLNKGYQSSLHYHKNKKETFYLLEGKLAINLEDREVILEKEEIIDIPTGQIHRINAIENSKLLEVSNHHEDSDSYWIVKGGKLLKAVILCGGQGTRLKPITYEIPKPLLPVKGKPILENLIDLLKKYEINEVLFAVGHLKEKIKEHFGKGYNYGIRAEYLEESKPLGTAGPLKLAEKLLDSTFIVSNGDELKDINIKEMLEQHKATKALITIALTEVADPSAYGVAKLDGNKIAEFVEKPSKDKAPSNFINAGFYIMEPEVLGYIPDGFSMLEKDLFLKIAKLGRLYGYKFKGQWFDTGNMERYEEAIKNWKGIS